ncbi:hypothetical protein E2C01_040121 [Portunus trituberculatus]|uniref:Uncharacterized protein n=1 Tax=Portunus trituberculatus TaxID=210409 RepID=A0A5B7FFL6_PORTR|nr:hypothetical protein [Portunus trituberculatus]
MCSSVLCTKLRNACKTLYFLKRLIYMFLRCFMTKKNYLD